MRAAVGAVDIARFSDIQEHTRVHAPERGARAGAVQRQVSGADLYWGLIFARGRGLRHRDSQRK